MAAGAQRCIDGCGSWTWCCTWSTAGSHLHCAQPRAVCLPPKLSRREAAVSSREILKNSQQWLQGHVRAEGCLEQHCGTLGSVLMATEWCWHCLFDHFQAVVMGTEIKSAQHFSPCHSEQRPMGH